LVISSPLTTAGKRATQRRHRDAATRKSAAVAASLRKRVRKPEGAKACLPTECLRPRWGRSVIPSITWCPLIILMDTC
jgi:hypothetical protein